MAFSENYSSYRPLVVLHFFIIIFSLGLIVGGLSEISSNFTVALLGVASGVAILALFALRVIKGYEKIDEMHKFRISHYMQFIAILLLAALILVITFLQISKYNQLAITAVFLIVIFVILSLLMPNKTLREIISKKKK